MNYLTANGAGISVPVMTLDDALADEKRPIRLLKIDVEGAELDVLRVAKHTLPRVEALYIELNPQNVARYGQEGYSQHESPHSSSTNVAQTI